MNEHKLPEEGFVKLDKILKIIPVSKSTWFRGIAAGKYPKGIKIGERASAWRVEEIRQCMSNFESSANHKCPVTTPEGEPTAAG